MTTSGPGRSVTRLAPAKLNVYLRVLGARDDGYHELESLVLPLSLADEVTVTEAARLDVVVDAQVDLSEGLDAGGMNLSLMAALALAEACGGPARGAEIRIVKRIPVAAGLGGGSADAAATLLALNELWGCGLDRDVLTEIGERIGSDVPAMLAGGPVVMRGRGERLAPVHVLTTWWVVRPFDFPTRSPDAYRWWDEDGGAVGPDAGALVAAAETGNVELLGHALFNDLEEPVVRRHPEVAGVKRAFLEAGALGAIMSGSGPTVVALARHLTEADRLAHSVPGSFVVSGPPAAG
ncbi:MAG: 4-(cytidine 5'-diphospho)-2-C-methyl-D-erythritol kinase [Actinomycetota bacterium]